MLTILSIFTIPWKEVLKYMKALIYLKKLNITLAKRYLKQELSSNATDEIHDDKAVVINFKKSHLFKSAMIINIKNSEARVAKQK